MYLSRFSQKYYAFEYVIKYDSGKKYNYFFKNVIFNNLKLFENNISKNHNSF